MGDIVELRPRAREDSTSVLGMIIALGAWAMMFGALFFMYAGMRSHALTWPPPGIPRLPVALPAVNTVVLLASSGAIAQGIRSLARGQRRALSAWLAVASVLGATFLVLQVVVWRDVWAAGLKPSTGAYGSVFYGLTALHAAHVAAGLLVILFVLVRSLLGKYTEHNVMKVRLPAMFWHFVDAVWVLMFVSLYLL
jgi:cytochrome c oxidase subunit 3